MVLVSPTLLMMEPRRSGGLVVAVAKTDDDGVASARFKVGSESGTYDVDSLTLTQVPEPSSTALLGLGGLALILRRRK